MSGHQTARRAALGGSDKTACCAEHCLHAAGSECGAPACDPGSSNVASSVPAALHNQSSRVNLQSGGACTISLLALALCSAGDFAGNVIYSGKACTAADQ
jgi:hypothetical protein